MITYLSCCVVSTCLDQRLISLYVTPPLDSIRLIGNLVGLDELVTVDGNARIEKSSFSLSPTVAKSTKKGKKQSQLSSQPVSSKKRLFYSHGSSVSNVNDMRLHKRGKIQKEQKKKNTESIEMIDCEPEEQEKDLVSSKTTSSKSNNRKSVTPSPHPPSFRSNAGMNNNSQVIEQSFDGRDNTMTPLRDPPSASRSEQHRQNRPPNNRNIRYSSRKSSFKPVQRGGRSAWFQEKRNHKTTQSTAFNSPKDNPFASYAFDPNNIENSLMTSSDKSKQPSIFPENARVASSHFTASASNARVNTFRTPANRSRKSAVGRISTVGLLQQKASEARQYQAMHQAPTPRNFLSTQPMIGGGSVQMGYRNEHSSAFQDEEFHPYSQPTGSVMHHTFGMAPKTAFTPPFASQNGMLSQNHRNYSQMSVVGGRPMSSAGHSYASFHNSHAFQQSMQDNGVSRFRQPPTQHQQQYHQHHQQAPPPPPFHNAFDYFVPPMQQYEEPPHYQYGMMAPSHEQQFDTFTFGMNPTDERNTMQQHGCMGASTYNNSYAGIGVHDIQPQHNTVRNPYAQQPVRQQQSFASQSHGGSTAAPPIQEVVVNRDDPSLAFDDAFL